MDLLPYVLDPSAEAPNLLQLVANAKGREAQESQNSFEFPKTAIVRVVQEDENITKALNTALRATFGELQALDTKFYSIYLEVEGLTETFLNYFKGNITKERYYGSLLKTYMNVATTNGRIPISNEVVLVEYTQPNFFQTIEVSGFPALQPEIDPNLSSYIKKENNSTRNSFPQGA
jgi:hypothetical protein